MLVDDTKTCPACCEDIKARARVCYHCGTRFDVDERGYCGTCHSVQTSDEGRCAACGAELVDVVVDSRPLVTAGAPTSDATRPPPPPPTPTAMPPPGGVVAPPLPPPPVMAPPPTGPASGWVPPVAASAPPPAWAPAPVAPPAPPRRGGRALAWTFAVLLALIGLGAWGLATMADNSNEDEYAAEYVALGDRDGEAVAATLDARVVETSDAYDAFVDAMNLAAAKHEEITATSNDLVAAHNADDEATETAKEAELQQRIDEFAALLDQQRLALLGYADRLAALKAEVNQ